MNLIIFSVCTVILLWCIFKNVTDKRQAYYSVWQEFEAFGVTYSFYGSRQTCSTLTVILEGYKRDIYGQIKEYAAKDDEDIPDKVMYAKISAKMMHRCIRNNLVKCYLRGRLISFKWHRDKTFNITNFVHELRGDIWLNAEELAEFMKNGTCGKAQR